jgi:hypothetical protein
VLVPLGRRIRLDLTFPRLRAVPWRQVRRSTTAAAAGLFAAAVLASVGGPAGVASYRHAETVFRRYGETAAMAQWLPLTTDGMLIAAIFVMYWRRYRRERVGVLPWSAFLAGMVATLAANLAAADLTATNGDPGEIIGRIATAVWPPICLAFTLELAASLIKGGQRLAARTTGKAKAPKRDEQTAPPAAAATRRAVLAEVDTAVATAKRKRAGRLSDEELVEKIRAWMAETGQPAPSKWAIRQEFGLGDRVAGRVYPLLGIGEQGAA